MRWRRRKPGDVLLEHLERDLGRYEGGGVARPEWELDFSVLEFPDRPGPGVAATVSFGISTHVVTARDGSTHAQELLAFLRDAQAAQQIVANVGAYVVDRHVALLEGETIGMPGADSVIDVGNLDTLVAATPEPYPRLARCDALDPPVEIVWLLPFASSEHHVVAEHGWRDLLHWIRRRGLDRCDLSRETVL